MSAASSASESDDPFARPMQDRTFIVPKPGARPAAAPPPPQGTLPGVGAPEAARDFPKVRTGLNPLVALANDVLVLVPQLRATVNHPDPAGLKKQLAQEIRDFERRCQEAHLSADRIVAARYILCTVLDEAAAETPWGGAGVWAKQSLLVMFHEEAWGGEKVFELMGRLANNVPANRDLLELIYACLAMGFEGRYRVTSGGGTDLDAIRARLAQLLQGARGSYPPALAQHWDDIVPTRHALASWLPLWVSMAAAAALLVLAYFGFSLSLASNSDAVARRLDSLRLAPMAVPAPAPVAEAPPATARLAPFLAEEIAAGLVQVRDEFDRSTVTIQGDNLFEPGSDAIAAQHEALLSRIGEALAKVPGLVVVTGHTDNRPIRTIRFPSNWELSRARAEAVRPYLLAAGVAPDRVRAEARAETEPLTPNQTPEGRARNRRVEITLLAGKR